MPSFAKQKIKEIAGGLLTKVVDNLNKDDDDKDERPPTPPPKPAHQPTHSGVMGAAQSLVQSFHGLHIGPESSAQPSSSGGFVGGFHPGYAYSDNPSAPPLHHALSEPPPKMPLPSVPGYPSQQSLTMQMALRPELSAPPPRPSSAPSAPIEISSDEEDLPATPAKKPSKPTPGASKPSTPKPSASKPKPKPPANKPSTPQRPTKPSTASSSDSCSPPSTPNGKDKDGQVQCSGTTKAGKQCTRFVKVAPALSQKLDGDDDDDEDDPPLERFCFQHTKELLTPSGCYARKNGEWINFDDWIPAHLQQETQLSLRIEMERARSQSDVDGYIYTFEIRDDDREVVKLKVGRAVNLVKRVDQWGKQCGSKEQVLRGFYPNPEDDQTAQSSLMKGKVRAGQKSPCCHRLERLIHLELADLSATQVYLNSGWPDIDSTDVSSATASGKRNAPKKAERCLDCGSMHKEIFEFQRWASGPNKNKEWEKIVKPVIERWGKFIELYL